MPHNIVACLVSPWFGGCLQRCHPYSRFIQSETMIREKRTQGQRLKLLPKQLSNQFSEINPFFSDEIECQLSAIPG